MESTNMPRAIAAPSPVVTVSPPNAFDEALQAPAGQLVETRSGDVCSLLGIVGAATIAANHRLGALPKVERLGNALVLGSMAAAAVDTFIQSRNLARGEGESAAGTIAYAATGLIPAASLAALHGFHRHPSKREVVALAALAVNGAVLGYELITRGPDMVRGRENLSGYGSALASVGGFVVAHRYLLR
jgi:drug/metabolite transporter (DMT)-like permease